MEEGGGYSCLVADVVADGPPTVNANHPTQTPDLVVISKFLLEAMLSRVPLL